MRLTIDHQFSGTIPHLYEDGWLWVSQGNWVKRTNDLGDSWECVARLYDDPGRLLLTARRLTERLSRHGCFGLYRLPDGGLLATTRSGPRHLEPGSRQFRPMLDHPIDYRPMRRGVLVLPGEGGVLFGAYRHNGGETPQKSGRDAVEVMHYSFAERQWSKRFEFPPETARHIHAILADPHVSGQQWICTGDTDTESIIYQSNDDVRSVNPFAVCCQQSRTCDILFTETHLLWGVDSPLHQSGVVRMPREGGIPEWVCRTPAPLYYASRNERGHCFFSTTIEPGPAVESLHTEIYASIDGSAFKSVYQRRADASPQFAQTHFPAGVLPDNTLVWSSVATWRHEGTMMIGRLEA